MRNLGNYQIADYYKSKQHSHMIRLTGAQLAAGRVLACLSRQELAERAGLSYHTIRAWEASSASVPEATYSHLCRAVDALEATGVRFAVDGVYLQRPAQIASTVIHSEGAAA
jgi:transcriptional regulator with XRE-family HTH domain